MTTPSNPSVARNAIFIHGLWLHASSWAPWTELFEAAGYTVSAPGWPGEPDTVAEARENPDSQAGTGIEDVVAHYTSLIEAMDVAPVLIGHSFGGAIVERLLGEGKGAAGVAIDAAPIKGVLPLPISSLRSAFPVLKNPGNKKRAISLSEDQFHYGFGNAIPREESDELFERWTIPAPGKPLFQAASANFSRHSEAAVDTENETRGPLLLIAGGKDHTVPEVISRSTLKQYRHSSAVTDLITFPDRGHSLVIDHGWRDVAEASLNWLRDQDEAS